jgi:hypothetical protein
MISRPSRTHRAIGAPLSALLVLLSLAVPLMDRMDVGFESVLESQHDPAECAPAHDHTICTQVGANLALATPAEAEEPHPPAVTTAVTREVRESAGAFRFSDHRSRAPPTI